MHLGYIKLWRRSFNNGFHKDHKTWTLFTYLLCKASFKKQTIFFDGKDVDILRGQLITGREALAKELDMSPQNIRTCIKRLKSTGRITITSTNRYSIITICNYEKYQSDQLDNQPSNQPAGQPSPNQVLTTKKKEKERKERKEERKKIKKEKYAEEVFFTKQEYINLVSQYGRQLIDLSIIKLNNYKLSSGKKYKSDYHAMLSWAINSTKKEKFQAPNNITSNSENNVITIQEALTEIQNERGLQ